MDFLDVLEAIAIIVLMFFILMMIFASDPWGDNDNYYHRF